MTQFESDIFDFNNIPMSELDKAYIDYEPLYDTRWIGFLLMRTDIPIESIRDTEDKTY